MAGGRVRVDHVVALRVSPETHAALRALAEAEKRSINGQIVKMLEDALKDAGKGKP